jgi:hypothetical protein
MPCLLFFVVGKTFPAFPCVILSAFLFVLRPTHLPEKRNPRLKKKPLKPAEAR